MQRKEAKAVGTKVYHSGRACKRGHEAGRWTSNGRCVKCSMAASREWLAGNTEYNIARCRRWREDNYEEHLAKARARLSKRWSTNEEACRAYEKKYARKRNAARRARKVKAEGSFTLNEIAELLERQRAQCAYFSHCGHIFIDSKYHIDHIQPLSRGGGNSIDNLQLLWKSCNSRKGARNPLEFEAMIGIVKNECVRPV